MRVLLLNILCGYISAKAVSATATGGSVSSSHSSSAASVLPPSSISSQQSDNINVQQPEPCNLNEPWQCTEYTYYESHTCTLNNVCIFNEYAFLESGAFSDKMTHHCSLLPFDCTYFHQIKHCRSQYCATQTLCNLDRDGYEICLIKALLCYDEYCEPDLAALPFDYRLYDLCCHITDIQGDVSQFEKRVGIVLGIVILVIVIALYHIYTQFKRNSLKKVCNNTYKRMKHVSKYIAKHCGSVSMKSVRHNSEYLWNEMSKKGKKLKRNLKYHYKNNKMMWCFAHLFDDCVVKLQDSPYWITQFTVPYLSFTNNSNEQKHGESIHCNTEEKTVIGQKKQNKSSQNHRKKKRKLKENNSNKKRKKSKSKKRHNKESKVAITNNEKEVLSEADMHTMYDRSEHESDEMNDYSEYNNHSMSTVCTVNDECKEEKDLSDFECAKVATIECPFCKCQSLSNCDQCKKCTNNDKKGKSNKKNKENKSKTKHRKKNKERKGKSKEKDKERERDREYWTCVQCSYHSQGKFIKCQMCQSSKHDSKYTKKSKKKNSKRKKKDLNKTHNIIKHKKRNQSHKPPIHTHSHIQNDKTAHTNAHKNTNAHTNTNSDQLQTRAKHNNGNANVNACANNLNPNAKEFIYKTAQTAQTEQTHKHTSNTETTHTQYSRSHYNNRYNDYHSYNHYNDGYDHYHHSHSHSPSHRLSKIPRLQKSVNPEFDYAPRHHGHRHHHHHSHRNGYENEHSNGHSPPRFSRYKHNRPNNNRIRNEGERDRDMRDDEVKISLIPPPIPIVPQVSVTVPPLSGTELQKQLSDMEANVQEQLHVLDTLFPAIKPDLSRDIQSMQENIAMNNV